MSRRKRSDSIEAKSQAMSRAIDGPPAPPAFCNVPSECMPFWDAIMNTKDYEMWTPNDLVVAASLARISMEIEQYSQIAMQKRRLVKEQDVISVSPVHKILMDLQGQQATLCRTLQIHARATNGESTFQKKRNRLFYESQAVAEDTDEHHLLARPH
jgi:hypothetical protein